VPGEVCPVMPVITGGVVEATESVDSKAVVTVQRQNTVATIDCELLPNKCRKAA